MNRILLFDVMAGGHGPKNWEALLRSSAFESLVHRDDTSVTALIPKLLRDRLAPQMEDCPSWKALRVETDDRLDSYSNWKARAQNIRALLDLLKRSPQNSILFFYGDIALFFLPLVKLFAPQTWISILYFRPAVHYREYRYSYGQRSKGESSVAIAHFKDWLLLCFLKTGLVYAAGFQDDGAVQWYQDRGGRAIRFPAPPSAAPTNCSSLTHSDRMRFTIFGGLSQRKGVFVILDAFLKLPSELRSKVCLQLIGACEASERPEIHQAVAQSFNEGLSVSLDDRFVDLTEIPAVYEHSDVIVLCYEGMRVSGSGVLVQAATFGRPVLATKSGWVGKMVDQFKLGLAVDTTDPGAIQSAVGDFLSGNTRFDPKQAAAFSERHSPEIFGNALCALVLGNMPVSS